MDKDIIDALLGNSISDKDKESVCRDIMLNEQDPLGERLMKEYWDSCPAEFGKADIAGLKRFRRKMRRSATAVASGNRTALRVVLSAAVACVAFVLGLGLSSAGIMGGKVTLLSSESISSYTLPDGSRVRLNAGSSLSFSNAMKGRLRRVRLDGQAFFDVAKDPRRPFVVQMNKLKLEVLGTSFDASCFNDSEIETITLKTGSVKVTLPAYKNPVILKPDQKLVYGVYDGEYSVTRTEASNTCRWYETYLDFDNVRFADILTNIQSRYRVTVHNNAVGLADKRLSLTIDNDSLEFIMDVIVKLLPVEYEIHGNEIFINSK